MGRNFNGCILTDLIEKCSTRAFRKGKLTHNPIWHADCLTLIFTVLRRNMIYTTRLAKEHIMLYWAAIFLIIALVSGALGFGGVVAGTALSIAKVLFFIFLVLFVISLVMGRRPVV